MVDRSAIASGLFLLELKVKKTKMYVL